MENDNKRSADGKNNSSMVWFSDDPCGRNCDCDVHDFEPNQDIHVVSDFERLVRATQYDKDTGKLADGSDGSITVSEQRDNGRKIQYFMPTKIEIGARKLTGWAKMKIVEGVGVEKKKRMSSLPLTK